MRVLHVIPSLASIHGGPSAAMRVTERALTAEGITIETATTDDDGPGRRLARPLQQPLQEEGSTRRYFRKSTEFYKCSWSFVPWISRHVRDYDVVHIHALFSFTCTVAAWAARRAQVPYVVRPLGVLNEYGISNRRRRLKALSLRAIEGPIIERAAAMHFTSEAEQREAEGLGYRMRSEVVPLALESIDVPPAPPLAEMQRETSGKSVVLFLSRLDPKKNLEGLLTGFAQAMPRLADTLLVIAGAGDDAYVAGLKREAERLGLARSVLWVGHVDGSLKASLLRGATAFVLPSHSENFGIAAAEALAAGVPCVLGRGVALGENVEREGAGLVVAPDAGSIAEGLVRLLSSGSERVQMGERGRKLAVREFSAAVMGRRLRSLYERVLQGRA